MNGSGIPFAGKIEITTLILNRAWTMIPVINADPQQRPESVGSHHRGSASRAKAAVRKRDDRQSSDQAKLLANNRKDKIRIRIWQIEKFLLALGKTFAESLRPNRSRKATARPDTPASSAYLNGSRNAISRCHTPRSERIAATPPTTISRRNRRDVNQTSHRPRNRRPKISHTARSSFRGPSREKQARQAAPSASTHGSTVDLSSPIDVFVFRQEVREKNRQSDLRQSPTAETKIRQT